MVLISFRIYIRDYSLSSNTIAVRLLKSVQAFPIGAQILGAQMIDEESLKQGRKTR